MPTQPVRFIHAGRLRLDGVPIIPGDLAPEHHRLAEDCTLVALERVVEAAIDQDVDFVLLTGDLFAESVPTLRSQSRLADAVEALAEFGIPTVVVCDTERDGDALPRDYVPRDCLVITPELESRAVPLNRDGAPLVVFITSARYVDRDAPTVSALDDNSPAPACIALEFDEAPTAWNSTAINWPAKSSAHDDRSSLITAWQSQGVHYVVPLGVAAGEPSDDDIADEQPHRPTTCALDRLLIHAPGTTQGLSPDEAGPHGCTLVEIDADGHTTHRRISTAAVRYERRLIDAAPHWTTDDLVERMQLALLDREAETGEQLWVVRWTLAGRSQWLAELAATSASAALWQRLNVETGTTTSPPACHHQLDLRPRCRRSELAAVDELVDETLQTLRADGHHWLNEALADLIDIDPTHFAAFADAGRSRIAADVLEAAEHRLHECLARPA